MKFVIYLVAALFGTTVAAQGDCRSGTPEVIGLLDWRLEVMESYLTGEDEMQAVFLVENKTGSEIIAIAGQIEVFDPLDRRLFIVHLPSVPEWEADGKLTIRTFKGEYGIDAANRLPKEAVTILVCTRRLAYADGTTEDF